MSQAHAPRINEFLLQYWQDLKAARPLPFEHEISADTLRGHWPSCYLVAVKATGFGYEHLGAALCQAYGDDFTGREITEALVYPHPPSLFASFARVVETAKPTTDESQFTNRDGATVKYRAVVLPFASRGRSGVAFLLGGMRWKID